MKTIAITIEEDTLKRIDVVAAQKGQAGKNRSQFIRDAIKDCLARIEKEKEEDREREIIRRNRSKLHRQAVALIKEQARRRNGEKFIELRRESQSGVISRVSM